MPGKINRINGYEIQALSSSYAVSASFVESSSYALSSSFVISSSRAVSASFATTASFALNAIATNTGSLLTTASVILNTITFTKGDGSTFPITVNTGSGGTVDTSGFVTTSSFNSFTSSINSFTSSYNTGSFTGSFTGSLFGTASWAINALTASYAQNLIISGAINNVDYIDFNTGSAVPAWKSGRVFWDNTDGALSVYNAEQEITLQVGQENWTRVSNRTGTTILNGTVVRIIGAHGDVPEVERAQALAVSGSVNVLNQILGVATHDIEDNSKGYVTTQGLVRGLNTNTFTEGDTLFVGTGSAGTLTNIPPRAPYEIIPVGVCVKASPGTSGIIYVAVQEPIDFGDLSSVVVSGSYHYGDIWTYVRSGSFGVWTHTNQLSGSYGLTGSLNATAITSSLFGTASWATNAQTASFLPVGTYAITASWAQSASQAISASRAITSSFAVSASQAVTASFALSSQTNAYYAVGAPNVAIALNSTQFNMVEVGAASAAGENTRQQLLPPGLVSDFYIRHSTAHGGNGNITYTIRKNGADTPITITVISGSAAGIFSDTVNTTTSNGTSDLFSIRIVNASTSGAQPQWIYSRLKVS